MNTLYTATAVATGDGRNGQVQTIDGMLDVSVRIPPELGGPGGATNPEQLFAAGYAACFHSALKMVSAEAKADSTDSEVVADVMIGKLPDGGYGLTTRLEVTMPLIDKQTAEQVVAQAHQVCPYSNATRGSMPVTLSVA